MFPKKAAILRLTKKFSQIKQNSSIMHNLNHKSFLFPLPKVIANDAIECKDLKDPKRKTPKSIKQIELIFSPNIPDSVQLTKMDQQKHKLNADKIIDENVKDKIRSCKVCWVFNKATCKTCLEASKAIEMEESLPKNPFKVMVECSLCWIFKKAGQCNFCKRIVVTSGVVRDLDDKESETKRQATTVQNQEKLWQRNVCLTNNIKRLTCICCEVIKTQVEKTNFQFRNNSFNKELRFKTSEESIQSNVLQDCGKNKSANISQILDTTADIKTDKDSKDELMDIECDLNTYNYDSKENIETMDTFDNDNHMIETVTNLETKFVTKIDGVMNLNTFQI